MKSNFTCPNCGAKLVPAHQAPPASARARHLSEVRRYPAPRDGDDLLQYTPAGGQDANQLAKSVVDRLTHDD